MIWFVAAALADPAPDPFALPATVVTLDNGLTVLFLEDHRTDVIALQIRFGVGSRDEQAGELGCAHLFEHLMFEGSKDVGANKFDEWLSSAGGENNASTDEDRTEYHETFPAGALDVALFLESDRMGFLDAGLVPENVKNQQDVVLRERGEDYAEPNGRDLDSVSRLRWPAAHPYNHPVIGTVADVSGFTVEGVDKFWLAHYRSRNAVMALVGNFDTAQAIERVKFWFSDVPDRGPPVERAQGPLPGKAAAGAGVVEDEVEERTMYLVWEGVRDGDPDMPALDILSSVLSNGHGTRLDEALYYQHRYASSVFAWTWNADLAGMFAIAVSSPDTKLAKLQKLALQQVDLVKTTPPTAAEVDRARKSIRASILDGLESPEGKADALTQCWHARGKADCLADEWKTYEAVTPADVTRVASSWLGPAPTTLSNVPKGDAASALPGSHPVELP